MSNEGWAGLCIKSTHGAATIRRRQVGSFLCEPLD